MFKGMSQFKALFDEFVSGRLTGNEQLVTLHVNIAMNNAHWAKTIRLSDNSLLALLNQYDSTGKPLTLESVRRIKQKLKNKGLIDFTSGKGNQVSEYRLVKLYADEPCPHDTDDPADTAKQSPADLLYSNNTNNSTTEDIKTEDIKQQKQPRERDFSIKGLCSEKVRVEWIKAKGVNPSYNIAQELGRLEQQHGTEKLVQAIQEADRANSNSDGINLNFVITKLNQILYSRKGATKVGRNNAKSEYRSQYDDL